jgi:hypothetical protein
MSFRSSFVLSIACVLAVTACAQDAQTDVPTKDELAQGKADSSFGCWLLGAPSDCDVCEEMGWYQDDKCDQILVDLGVCGAPDPDCAPACFLTHLDEAIALNRERRSRYEALTDGASLAISNRLITTERISRVAAIVMDDRARRWQRRGVDVLCDEFVSMDETPAFRDHSEPVPFESFVAQGGAGLALRLGDAWLDGGYTGLAAAAEYELELLADAPSFHCMVRHLLESIVRAANLAPIHVADAAALGLDSPAAISRDFIALQITSLALATGIDEDAAPIQAQGVPIICQDVPPIPPLP